MQLADHVKKLNICYIDVLKYAESVMSAKPQDPNYAAEEAVYNSWNDWWGPLAERTQLLGKPTKVKPKKKVFDGYDNTYDSSWLIRVPDLTIAQLQACPIKLRPLIDEAIRQNFEYLIIIQT